MEGKVVMAVMRNIASGADKHGGFLTSFADAMCRADDQNLHILMPAAFELVRKYDLVTQQEISGVLRADQVL